MSKLHLYGIIPPMITPFNWNGDVDHNAFISNIERWNNDQLAGNLVLGSNSEAPLLAQSGEADAALDEIERLLAGPSWLSVHTLRLDPRWDPIREHPRFKTLLDKYAQR